MGTSRVLCGDAEASQGILTAGYYFHVTGIHTVPHSAKMVNRQALWDGTT